MNRLLGTLFGAALVVLMMFWPAAGDGVSSSSDASSESARITDYNAKFTVDKDGDLHATETLKVNFPLYKHGIFRFFDIQDPTNPHVRLVPENIAVTRDGQSDGLDLSKQGHGRFIVARIGEEYTTIDGDHTYVITYDVPGALADGVQSKNDSLFYWNLIPGGWQMPIEQSSLSVSLPGGIVGTPKCAIGNGQTGGCDAEASGDGLTVSTGAVEPNTPVTVQTEVDVPPPGQKSLPWAQRFDAVFGQSVPALTIWVLLGLVALALGWFVARLAHEDTPAYPLMYAPPEGIGPAQGAYILTERTNDDQYAATMLQLGEGGVATIEHPDDKRWTITGTDGDWNKVDAVTAQTAAALGISGKGASFTAQEGDVDGGEKMKSARNGFDSAVKAWARQAGLVNIRGAVGTGIFGVIAGAVVMLFCFFVNPFGMSVIGLPFGLFAVAGLPLLSRGSTTYRTKAGRDLWSRIGGFQRVLGTSSSEARFDFSGRKELYTQYIPWAVAFGVADIWAQKYRVEVGEEPPVPGYFHGTYVPIGYGGGGGGSMQSFSTSFNSTVGSAISAYTASQSSSSGGGGGFSGGGGGFSGGGGGGGGGGGSW